MKGQWVGFRAECAIDDLLEFTSLADAIDMQKRASRRCPAIERAMVDPTRLIRAAQDKNAIRCEPRGEIRDDINDLGSGEIVDVQYVRCANEVELATPILHGE